MRDFHKNRFRPSAPIPPPGAAEREETMASEARIKKFRGFIEAWTKRDLARVDELLAPNAIYHMPPFPDFSGTGPLKQFIADFHQAFPDDFRVTFDEDLEAGSMTV